MMTDRVCDGCAKAGGRVQIHQSNGSEFRELWLCPSCAALIGAEQPSPTFGPTVGELLGTLGGNNPTRECPNCGTRFKHIRQTGRVGCAHCYHVFRNRIQLLLSRMGLTDPHAGRYPIRLASYKRLFVDRSALEDDLKAALGREDYEHAADLRDRIRALEEADQDG